MAVAAALLGVPLALSAALGSPASHHDHGPFVPDRRAVAEPSAPTSRERVHVNIAPLPLDTYVNGSTDFVVGTVLGVRVADDPVGRPATVNTVRVDTSMRGAVHGTVEIWVGGDSTAGSSYDVVGAPRFELGDRVGAFLCGGPEQYGILGLQDGAYRVVLDGTVERVVGRHASGTPVHEFVATMHDSLAVGGAR